LSKIKSWARYPATKGRPGGKLPAGKRASRFPCFSVSHEAHQLASVLDEEEEMKVGRQHTEGTELELVALLSGH
jgi:hypothetical protein